MPRLLKAVEKPFTGEDLIDRSEKYVAADAARGLLLPQDSYLK